MNYKTANKLNQLLANSTPLCLAVDGFRIEQQNTSAFATSSLQKVAFELAQKGRAIMESHTAQAQAEEIKHAAKAHSIADAARAPRDRECLYSDSLNSVSGREAVISRPQIEALIAADNAKRLAEYETYRIACEQGVAVPPQE